ncbi:uncharacterized protein LOC133215246 [Neopsephotus bourkii]|uniref:uncharacterized protein LOC133215246 n=1 Tax=Neopsephotus bourkii TaxID=309878 RepID=UPI002AA59390|nr:uncharacterized protein LOC133215246 [Neopsephotus bourkii]
MGCLPASFPRPKRPDIESFRIVGCEASWAVFYQTPGKKGRKQSGVSGLLSPCLQEERQEHPAHTAPHGPESSWSQLGSRGVPALLGAGWARTGLPPLSPVPGEDGWPPCEATAPFFPSLLPNPQKTPIKIITPPPTVCFSPRGRAWAPTGAPCRGAYPWGRPGCLPGQQTLGTAETSGDRFPRESPLEKMELNLPQRRSGEKRGINRTALIPPSPTSPRCHPGTTASWGPRIALTTGRGSRRLGGGRGSFSHVRLQQAVLCLRPLRIRAAPCSPPDSPVSCLGFRAASAALPPLPRQAGSLPLTAAFTSLAPLQAPCFRCWLVSDYVFPLPQTPLGPLGCPMPPVRAGREADSPFPRSRGGYLRGRLLAFSGSWW